MSTTDLGTLGGSATYVTQIDDRGRVVGRSETTSGVLHAYRWVRGVMTDLTPELAGPSEVVAANERGQVLITGYEGPLLWSRGRSVEIEGGDAVDLDERGQVLLNPTALWDRGTVVPIEAPAGYVVYGLGLGDGGHAYGSVVPLPGPGGGHPSPDHWFVWKDGVMTPIDVAPYHVYQVVDVDREGRALVTTWDSDAGVSHALVWDGDGYLDLGSLAPAGDTGATDMNDRGQIVGSSATPGGHHAFLWEDGQMIDLTADAGNAYAAAISARGHVAGPLDTGRGFLWWCGALLDLGTPGVYVNRPVDVNARGQVVSEIDSLTGDRVVLSTPLRR